MTQQNRKTAPEWGRQRWKETEYWTYYTHKSATSTSSSEFTNDRVGVGA